MYTDKICDFILSVYFYEKERNIKIMNNNEENKETVNTFVIDKKDFENSKMHDVDPYLEVCDSGIMQVIQESEDKKHKIGKMIIPKEIFKEAYEKYCKEE